MKGKAITKATYLTALDQAIAMMEEGLEPTSALKQAGHDNGIPYGPEMGRFGDWADRQLFRQGRSTVCVRARARQERA